MEEKQYIGHGLKLFAEERSKAIANGRTLDKDISNNGSLQLVNIARFLLLNIYPTEKQKESTLKTLSQLCPNWDKTILKKYIDLPFKRRLVIAGGLLSAELDKIEFINDRLSNEEGQVKTFRTILQQDDCADPGGEYFRQQFKGMFDQSITEYLKDVQPIDLGDTYIYLKGDYKISNEIGFWKVEELEKEV